MQKEIRNCKKLGVLIPDRTKFGRNVACIASHFRARFCGVLLTGMQINKTQNFEMSAVATFEGNSVFDPTVLYSGVQKVLQPGVNFQFLI